MIFLMFFLNAAISAANAWGVGRSWAETRNEGGWPRFMAWCGAIMSGVGFTWCYLVIAALVCGPSGFSVLPPKYVSGMMDIGYLAIVFPLIGSGIAITIESWAVAWRTKRFGDSAVAGWNTYAQFSNMYGAVENVPKAFDGITDMFSGGDDDEGGGLALIALALAVSCLFAGFLTTAVIVRTTSKGAAFERYFR